MIAFHPISFQTSDAVTTPQNMLGVDINCIGELIIFNFINISFTIPELDNIFVTKLAATTHDIKCGKYEIV